MTTTFTPKQILDEIKCQLKTGKIDYDQAKDFASAPLAQLNDEMKVKSKEMGFKHYPVTFAKFMR